MTNFQKAIEFNKSFGVFVSDILVSDLFDTNPSLCDLRLSLIQEEIEELSDAFNTCNFNEIIDALADILVVVYGAGATFGINLDSNYRDLMLSSKGQNNYELTKYFLKNYKQLTLPEKMINIFEDHIIESNTYKQFLFSTLNKLQNYSILLSESHKNKDIDKYTTFLLKIIEFTYSISCLLGIDIQKAYNIVHESNMSKLCSSEQEAIDTVSWYKSNQTRYDTPNYKKSDNGINWVVFNESSGKILKSIKYIPANFELFFE